MNSKFPLSLSLETARVKIDVITKDQLVETFSNEELQPLSDSHRYFIILNADDHSPAGWMCIEEKENIADIKYIWLKEEYRSSKIFRETIFAFNNFCLKVLKLEKVAAKIPVDNTRAKSAFLKGAFIPQVARTKQPSQSSEEEFSIHQNEWDLRAVQFFGDIL